MLPINGIIGGAQPVMGYNYGAGEYKRVKKAIKIVTILTTSFTTIVWILLLKIQLSLLEYLPQMKK